MTYANTNIADIIKNMPKEFLPYINDNMRAELVNSIKNGDTINISSMLEETIAIDSISADFIRMRATKTTTIQLRLLDVSDSLQPLFVWSKHLKFQYARARYHFSQHHGLCFPKTTVCLRLMITQPL